MNSYLRAPHTELHRIPARGTYDRAIVHAILDEALVCHMGFVHDGVPLVIPTTFVRELEVLYVHGAVASRALKVLASGAAIAVTVTLVDGLVLARTAFHHSMNYRSVVVLGTARLVVQPREKRDVLAKLVEKLSPGRSSSLREPNEKELAATSVLAIALSEVSAKIRTGMPKEEEDPLDAVAPVWAGVMPLSLRAGKPAAENEDASHYELPSVPAAFAR